MPRRYLIHFGTFIAVCVVATLLAAEKLAERWQKRLDDVDVHYTVLVNRANDVRMYSLQKANLDRLKTLKTILADATKAGDLDAVNVIKEQVSAAERTTAERTRPKSVLKFGGHDYALIHENVSWHTAKRCCEEMGGHLVTFESPEEQKFVLDQAKKWNTPFWIGLSNEGDLGRWVWINGTEQILDASFKIDDPNRQFFSSAMAYWVDSGGLNDHNLGAHIAYACEWEY